MCLCMCMDVGSNTWNLCEHLCELFLKTFPYCITDYDGVQVSLNAHREGGVFAVNILLEDLIASLTVPPLTLCPSLFSSPFSFPALGQKRDVILLATGRSSSVLLWCVWLILQNPSSRSSMFSLHLRFVRADWFNPYSSTYRPDSHTLQRNQYLFLFQPWQPQVVTIPLWGSAERFCSHFKTVLLP